MRLFSVINVCLVHSLLIFIATTIAPKDNAWIRTMATNAVVLACANPVPEIWPDVARNAGAQIVATGRSDFPNQVNNSLVFPGLFRGVLDVRARTISNRMAIAAAEELVAAAREKGLSPDRLLPSMDDWTAAARVAAATGAADMIRFRGARSAGHQPKWLLTRPQRTNHLTSTSSCSR